MSKESRLVSRQDVNTNVAIKLAFGRDFTWLLHIDLDELLHESNATAKAWSQSWCGCVRVMNHEAVPLDHNSDKPFEDCVWFRFNNGKQPFMAYGNGKCAVRLSQSVRADGPHNFVGYTGELFEPSAEEIAILHYPTPSFDRWAAKYAHYGDFLDFWFGDPDKLNLVTFMIRSRDLI